jgi:molybdenum cofactor biosynthesis enzyme MoaA
MVNTLRILVSWKCNLNCSYCCNEQEQFRKDIQPVKLDDIDWNRYDSFCITGGEPLLNWQTVKQVCARVPKQRNPLVILYTNGVLFGETIAKQCGDLEIRYVNVGLHSPSMFNTIIKQVAHAAQNTRLGVRFHAQDVYEADLTTRYPHLSFRFWKMDDCHRNNEDRVILI